MASPASRTLRLIGLLQTRRVWAGAELAERLGVDRRSLRRDIERLRALGYAVQASSGVGGGYRLAAGAQMLPLLFEDDEAVTVAVALRAAAASMGGLEDTALRVLAKLDPLLPARVRQRAGALQAVTLSLGEEPAADTQVLTGIASACRDRRLLGFGYCDHAGRRSQRLIEPLRLVNYGRRWYLLGWDRERADWRTFRAERIVPPLQPGETIALRLPPRDPAAMVRDAIRHSPLPLQCGLSVRLRGSMGDLGPRIPSWCGTLEAEQDGYCRLSMLADGLPWLAAQLLTLGVPFVSLQADAAVTAGLRAMLGELLAQLPGAAE
ncbi:WYL domain-containing protein [Xanthomonas sp. CFBP 8703]|uniref:WYL domain-containing protein n=1 Tax=Xanthomonas bonasiae TaxID=2810351 RepID=A0ABS3BAN1_9XANT|nr:WYL domain-containing protein [Xanthomonas bonasiae]MBN6104665.1 WYL domain-containing protein [Xanthomonas bonasiae]